MELEEQLAQILKDSINDAFTTTLSLNPELTQESVTPSGGNGVVSSIGFTGTLEGNLAIHFSNKSACAVVSKMIGMDLEKVDADVCDGVGEVTNMVVGGIKMRAAEIEHKFEIGIPTVITGEEMHIISKKGDLFQITQRFFCEDVQFSVIFVYKKCVHDAEEVQTTQSDQPEVKVVEEKKSSPLDILNAATAGVEEKEEGAKLTVVNPLDALKAVAAGTEQKEEELEPIAVNPLDALKAAAAGTEQKEKEPESAAVNPLDALKAVATKGEKKEVLVEKKDFSEVSGVAAHLSHVAGGHEKVIDNEKSFEEEKPNPLDILNAAVASKEVVEPQEVSVEKKEENSEEGLSAIERLDQAMKKFKEIS